MKKLAGCVILNDQAQVLLLHRNMPKCKQWELPGGKVEEGETEAAAAIREVFEETGIEVELRESIGQAAFNENGAKYSYIWFLAEIKSGTPVIHERHLFDDVDYKDIFAMEDKELSLNVRNLKKNYRFQRIISDAR